MNLKRKNNQINKSAILRLGVITSTLLLNSCGRNQQDRDNEIRGLGMLEEKGFHGEMPEGSGTQYLYMRDDPTYKSADYSFFFARIKAYQHGRNELRKRGLSEVDLNEIPDQSLIDASKSGTAALDNLAKQYN